MLEPMATLETPQNVRGFSRAEYHKLFELGVLPRDLDCELLEGQVVLKMSPQKPPHTGLTNRLAIALRQAAERIGMELRIGQPFAATDDCEPEPDLMLVTREAAVSITEHPTKTFLVIEVCHTSDHNDRVVKTRVYARASVPEYWIVDVKDKAIEIYTQPRGRRYTNVRIISEGTIAPTALPEASVDVVALFAD